MSFDFSALNKGVAAQKKLNPIDLFRSLPSMGNAPEDVWSAQESALTGWHEKRDTSDALILMNTGSGKTIVGLLIAQSLVNEGLSNVIYVCASNALITQTKLEAERIGLSVTTRSEGSYSNELFEMGDSFLITNYQTILNSYSKFRGDNLPDAIVFDDAHVSESQIRDQFSLKLTKSSHKGLLDLIFPIARRYASELNIGRQLDDIFNGSDPSVFLFPPEKAAEFGNEIAQILSSEANERRSELRFPWRYIRDHLEKCCFVFGKGCLEVTPPFTPARILPIFSEDVRRVYLSATMQSEVQFIKAFGRRPTATIRPKDDTSGSGERLFLLERFFQEDEINKLIESLINQFPSVIAVPSFSVANKWAKYAEAASTDTFEQELHDFKIGKRRQLMLVGRVDGIDFPHDECRVLIIEGLPKGLSLIERFEYERLHLYRSNLSKIAGRITQLFGRIIRGRKDYGVIIVVDEDTSSWLMKRRNQAGLPGLIRKQLELGASLQKGLNVNNSRDSLAAISAFLHREKSWIETYQSAMNNTSPTQLTDEEIAENEMYESAAIKEANFMRLWMQGELGGAMEQLKTAEMSLRGKDENLRAWYLLWLYVISNELGYGENAKEYLKSSRTKLSGRLPMPQIRRDKSEAISAPNSKRVERIIEMFDQLSSEKLERRRVACREGFTLESGHKSHEEALREFGEFLGLISSRPDNEHGVGPDVLWYSDDINTAIVIECKTEKENNTIFKKDVAQMLHHCSWTRQTFNKDTQITPIFVGNIERIDPIANPPDDYLFVKLEEMSRQFDQWSGLLEAWRQSGKKQLVEKLDDAMDDQGNWSVNSLVRRLKSS